MAPPPGPYRAFCGSWAAGQPLDYDASYNTTQFLAATGRYATNGCEFRQLPQDVPWLRALYSDAELEFSSLPVVDWAASYGAVPVALCAVYLLLSLWAGPACMRARGPVPCKNQLAVWNLLLAVFSAAGFLRTAPHLLFYAWRSGGWASVCAPAETAFGQGAVGLWVMLFIFSKIPELVDTVFLVIAKKPVIFLHWYHHSTVLLYCAWRARRAARPSAAPALPGLLTRGAARPPRITPPPTHTHAPPPQAGTLTPRAPLRACTLCP